MDKVQKSSNPDNQKKCLSSVLCFLVLTKVEDTTQQESNVNNISTDGRAVARAVSRWLPTAAARVRIRAACGVCGGQSGTGAGFLQVLRFPLPIIPPISPS
jgi:hypothetical protein